MHIPTKYSKRRKLLNSQLVNTQTCSCCKATAAAEMAAGQLMAANTAGHLGQRLFHRARNVSAWLVLAHVPRCTTRKLRQLTTVSIRLAWLRAPQWWDSYHIDCTTEPQQCLLAAGFVSIHIRSALLGCRDLGLRCISGEACVSQLTWGPSTLAQKRLKVTYSAPKTPNAKP